MAGRTCPQSGRRGRDRYAQELHQRLLQDDPLAPAQLAEAFLDELVRRLRARAKSLHIPDDAVVLDAATDALLKYIQEPHKYNPHRSGFLTYLTMSAYRDLQNLLDQASRRRRREIPLEDVEHSLSSRNNVEEDLEEDSWQRRGIQTPEARATFLGRIAEEFPDLQDQQILSLMMSGERQTAAYSQVLGISHLEHKERQRIVKRHKDRLSKRLQRLGGKLGGPA
jgi:RNA polymerase sigma-70 factor, ECF subfamily